MADSEFKPGYGVICPGGDGSLPVLWACGVTIPEAWQNSMFALADYGSRIKTSFDREGDPDSRDATVITTVLEPFKEPRLHKLGWPGEFFDLEVYRLEVCFGIHNHWVERHSDMWNYTYHERITQYEWRGNAYNQLEGLVRNLVDEAKKGKLYRRRFQVTTWIPEVDQQILDPPCLQRIWFRFLPSSDGSWIMNVNTDWRSRDGYKASFMNMYAITDLCRLLAKKVANEAGIEIKMGRYTDKSDSLHVYGKDLEGHGGFDQVIGNRARNTPLEELTLNVSDFQDAIIEERRRIAAMLYTEKVLLGGKNVISPRISPEIVRNFPYPAEWDE